MSKNLVDLILSNGKVWTGNPMQPTAEAVAIAQGRIVAVGDNATILRDYQSQNSYDMAGRRLLPGLQDSHLHLISTGTFLGQISLVGCRSIGELQERLRTAPAGEDWIVARGFLQDEFNEKRMPTREDLDEVSATRPVFIVRACGHVAICNTLLLNMAGVVKGFGQVSGGEIGYDAQGEPNGFLAENAIGLARRLQPATTSQRLQSSIARAAAELLRSGITTAQSDDFGRDNWDLTFTAYQEAYEAGQLPLRVNHQMRFNTPEDVARFVAWRDTVAYAAGIPRERFAFGPVKLMCDGSLGGRTAAMADPYHDAPHTQGVAILSREEMTAIFREAHAAGFQLSGHAIGDKAITDLIEAMGAAIPEAEREQARPRVIHAQITTEAILQRMRELKVHCDIQPAFVPTDCPILDARVGPDKAATSYAWATMRHTGITTSGGSDSPVESYNPFYGIYCAVTRQNSEGIPLQGWSPQERLTVAEALKLYTYDGAYAIGLEGQVGQIAPTQWADMILIDRDIITVPHQEIKDIQVVAAWVDGLLAYQQ
ncbi:MAG: amidohydrolase [Symbiobacteriaceae bacterium]|nr:amidohydrolase [Symbiobacteriaceae bacterium]